MYSAPPCGHGPKLVQLFVAQIVGKWQKKVVLNIIDIIAHGMYFQGRTRCLAANLVDPC